MEVKAVDFHIVASVRMVAVAGMDSGGLMTNSATNRTETQNAPGGRTGEL